MLMKCMPGGRRVEDSLAGTLEALLTLAVAECGRALSFGYLQLAATADVEVVSRRTQHRVALISVAIVDGCTANTLLLIHLKLDR